MNLTKMSRGESLGDLGLGGGVGHELLRQSINHGAEIGAVQLVLGRRRAMSLRCSTRPTMPRSRSRSRKISFSPLHPSRTSQSRSAIAQSSFREEWLTNSRDTLPHSCPSPNLPPET